VGQLLRTTHRQQGRHLHRAKLWRLAPGGVSPSRVDSGELFQLGRCVQEDPKEKDEGKEVLCVEFDDLRRSQMCFQESDGTIAGNNIYSFSDFRPFEGKTVPRKIASDEITIVVESLDKVERLALPAINSDFKGPFDGCYQPAIPLLQDSTVHPRYPQEAKSARIQGESYVYAAIDSSGSVSATLSLAGSQPVFAATSKAAVQYWKYAPAKCGDTAVPYERVETIHFTLSGG